MLDEFEIALSQIASPTFPRQSWELQWRTRFHQDIKEMKILKKWYMIFKYKVPKSQSY